MSFTSDFNGFTARLREFIHASDREGGRADCGIQTEQGEGLGAPALPSYGFDAVALGLFGLQFQYNAPYRRFCEARGVRPNSLKDWSQIPAMPTSAFKELELSCLPAGERTSVFHSSGTTEHRPSRHFHNAESLAVYEEAAWEGFWEGRREKGEGRRERESGCVRLLILTPPPAQAPHSSLVHMFETLRRRLGLVESVYAGRIDSDGAWALDLEKAIGVLNDVRGANQALLLLGTAFSYVHLLDGMVERGLAFELPPGSQAMETGGYKGRSRDLPKTELHSFITSRLGIPRTHILCEYGMSELSSQAYEREKGEGRREKGETGGTFLFPPWARARIISPETGLEVAEGKTGLIRVFDLANVYSVMAVQTEDLGVRRGDGFELIGRAALAEARGCSLMAV